MRRGYVLRGELVDPEPEDVHADGAGRRRLPPDEPRGESADVCAPAHKALQQFLVERLLSLPTPGSFLWEAASPHVSLPAEPVLRLHRRREIQMSVPLQVPGLLPLRTLTLFHLPFILKKCILNKDAL